jgi:hypothetical protein
MDKFKKHIAIVLLVVIALPSLVAIYTASNILWIQYEMKEKLEYSNLQTITVNNSSFKWIEKDREILVNGKYFDVKSHQSKGEQTTFSGLFDEDETTVSMNAENAATNTPQYQLLVQAAYFFQHIQENQEKAIFTFYTENISRYYETNKHKYPLSPFISVPTPPPNQSFS